MSTPRPAKKSAQSRRQQLIEDILMAGREGSAATIMFHTAMAQRAGLTPTDAKTLDTLLRTGPLTAGELAGCTGLATASVTSLIDRLEQKGLVRRGHDARDRRRVIVKPVHERITEGASIWGSVRSAYADLLRHYTAEQLEIILDFMRRSGERTRALTSELSANPKSNTLKSWRQGRD